MRSSRHTESHTPFSKLRDEITKTPPMFLTLWFVRMVHHWLTCIMMHVSGSVPTCSSPTAGLRGRSKRWRCKEKRSITHCKIKRTRYVMEPLSCRGSSQSLEWNEVTFYSWSRPAVILCLPILLKAESASEGLETADGRG